MFRCPATIWLSEVITMMCKHITSTKLEKGTTHIDSRDGIPADLKLLHYIETTSEYKVHNKITNTKVAWLCTIAHSFLFEMVRTRRTRPNRNKLSIQLIEQIKKSTKKRGK